MKNKFYYVWGDEPIGYVTTWKLIKGKVRNTKQEPREVVTKQQLKYDCPFSQEVNMKLIKVLQKLTNLDDKIEIVGLSGQTLMISDAGSVPVMYLRCECSNVKIDSHYTFTIV